MCLIGAIPSILYFTGAECPYAVRSIASLFVKNLCASINTIMAQMFMSCGGLDTLISYFGEDFPKYELARNATDAIESLLNLQCSIPRSTICSVIVSRGSVPRMIRSLSHFTSSSCTSVFSDTYAAKIVNMFMTISMAGAEATELFVKDEVAISGMCHHSF